MTTTDCPESGALNPKDDDQPTASPATDQRPTAPTTVTTDPAQTAPIGVADPSTPATQPLASQPGQAAVANHPATTPGTGGETAPVTVTATTGAATTSTSNDTSSAVAQPNSTAATTTSMDTEEPKAVQELSTEQSDDGSGKEVEDAGPSLVITLLLTTGSRHPFTIDGKYLRKRSVNVENSDPFLMSVYTLKELIWREWRAGMDELDIILWILA